MNKPTANVGAGKNIGASESTDCEKSFPPTGGNRGRLLQKFSPFFSVMLIRLNPLGILPLPDRGKRPLLNLAH